MLRGERVGEVRAERSAMGGGPCRNVEEVLSNVLCSESESIAALLADFEFTRDRRAGHQSWDSKYYNLAARKSLDWLFRALRDDMFCPPGLSTTGRGTFSLGYRPAKNLNACAKAVHAAYSPSKKEEARYGILARRPT